MNFTFYGDLLGTASFYRLNSQIAYEKLNKFYNLTYDCFNDYCRENPVDITVNLFSDSILVWGNDLEKVLEKLSSLYIKTFNSDLLLRGAIVKGKLNFDPRLVIENLQKKLPTDDTLARAVGLSNSYKGARFIIENSLANYLFNNTQEWMTAEGYLSNIRNNIPLNDVTRRICPTPENSSYELLYFWQDRENEVNNIFDYENRKTRLTEISKNLQHKDSIHYRQTIKLLERSQRRQRYTEKRISN